jgi:hypothetical protein
MALSMRIAWGLMLSTFKPSVWRAPSAGLKYRNSRGTSRAKSKERCIHHDIRLLERGNRIRISDRIENNLDRRESVGIANDRAQCRCVDVRSIRSQEN